MHLSKRCSRALGECFKNFWKADLGSWRSLWSSSPIWGGKKTGHRNISFKLTFISSFCWQLSFLGPSSSLKISAQVIIISAFIYKQTGLWIVKLQNNMTKFRLSNGTNKSANEPSNFGGQSPWKVLQLVFKTSLVPNPKLLKSGFCHLKLPLNVPRSLWLLCF